ncbi:dienelactone hydrolase family protein [Sulfurospirillum sp. T05]|uniref:Dienelactone hydrolase family protein n=1 Tax=Sulfurospirillum tamanense TaxID=2813362 RepID=A0ABS2WUT3_9BACT|nr:dienelactone hydrolase family protein [Sulfurospirillum tamanensis]MBN2965138.1 dienelactone hydrolase family protein [Sulfurospirillum tamanensis]
MTRSIVGWICAGVLAFANGAPVVYEVEGKTYEGYYTSPHKTAPLVLLVHDWDGLDGYEKKRASMLHEMGYATFAVDMFGKGVVADTVEKRRALTGDLYNDRLKMRAILQAGVDAAKRVGANVDNAIGIGYCFGGTVILDFARSGAPLKAFVPFHGGLATPQGQSVEGITGEVVVFHGTADTAISMEEFATFAKELESAGISHEMHTYSGAPHAFSVFGTPRYHAEADRKSWERFSGYLKEVFGK